MTNDEKLDLERRDLLQTLGAHRGFLRHTVAGLSDVDAARRSTVSALCLGGLINHVTAAEAQWAAFIVRGAAAMAPTEDAEAAWAAGFEIAPGDTVTGLLERYQAVAERTDDLVRTLPDLDAAQALPEAPWFPPGATWSARRVFLHIIAETAQHAGHADILRESIDGAKTMG